MSLNEYVDNILSHELNNNDVNKLIIPVNNEVSFKYNSFNICIGKQSTGKTTSVLKELIKLSLCKEAYNFHLIIYVSNNDSDDTFNKLKDYITIPIVKLTYDKLDKTFEQFIKLKDLYNSIVDGKHEPMKNELEALNKNLYVNDFSKKRLHTIILMDDAAFVLKRETSPWFKWLCQLRHLNCTVFLCIQIWKSINPSLKSQITSIYLFGGYSRQQLNYIYQQICLDLKFDEFYNIYTKLGKNKSLIIDMINGRIQMN